MEQTKLEQDVHRQHRIIHVIEVDIARLARCYHDNDPEYDALIKILRYLTILHRTYED